MQNKPYDVIPHYHGDIIRILFVSTAALSFLSSAILGPVLPFGVLFEVSGGILLIALAGLTNPHGHIVMRLNILAAGVGTFLFEMTAITYRNIDSIQLLLVREIGVLLLVSALYFSVKTVRAMSSGVLGVPPKPWEMEETAQEKDTW